MAPIKLSCIRTDCPFVTDEVDDAALAERLLDRHLYGEHDQGQERGGRGETRDTSGQSHKGVKKPDRPMVDMDTTEGEWSIFLDSWTRYKRMTAITEGDTIRDELRECCSKALNTRLIQMHGSEKLSKIGEDDLKDNIKEVAVKGVHKEVHRAAFQGLNQQQGETYQAYAARLKAKADLAHYSIIAPSCTVEGCSCPVHGREMFYRDEMVGTQLVAGAYNKDHQAKILSESVNLVTLQQKLDRLTTLEKSESSSATLSSGSTAGVQQVESSKRDHPTCRVCNRVHKKCRQCQRPHPCSIECHTCKKKGHVRACCPNSKQEVDTNMVQEVGFSMTVQAQEEVDTSVEMMALEFMASQEQLRVKKEEKKSRQRSQRRRNQATVYQSMIGEIGHMEWDQSSQRFVSMSPSPPPILEVSLRVMMTVQRNLVGKSADSRPNRKYLHTVVTEGLGDTGAQVCTAGMNMLDKLGVHRRMLASTSLRIKGVKGSELQVLGVLAVEVSAGGNKSQQLIYFTRETRQLIISKLCMVQLGLLDKLFPQHQRAEVKVTSKVEVGMKAKCGCLVRSEVPPLPTELPFPPTRDNLDNIEKWIKTYYASSAFNVCEHQQLQTMAGPPMKVNLKKEIEPVAVHQPIPVPHHWREQVLAGLDRDCNLGVIEPVPTGTPTTWCSRMVVTPKHDGSPRRTVDLQALNRVAYRETHHTPSPFNLVSQVPKGRWKTVLDAWNGYHAVPLDPSSSHYTTFITDWGRYWYKRAPQGFAPSGDAYTKRFDDITVDIPDKVRIVDDTLLHEPTIETSFFATCRYIDVCGRAGVVFNPEKFVFSREEVDFAGFTVADSDIRPTKRMLATIRDFPKPENLTGARAWFGLVNQVAFSFAQTSQMAPFRELLKRNQKFYWDDEMDALFELSKEVIVNKVIDGVRRYEVGKPTCLATDFSKTGVGFFLLQQECQCDPGKGPNCGPGHWRLVLAGSRFLKDAETRYAPPEGEMLAIVFGLEQCRMFLLGCPHFYIATDHKPLLPLLGDKSMDQIKNPRLLSMKEKTLMYSFEAKHVPGALNFGPDATSRYPAKEVKEVSCHLIEALAWCDPVSGHVEEPRMATCQVVSGEGDETVTWEQVKEAAWDESYQELARFVVDGFPNRKSDLGEGIKQFFNMREELYLVEGVVFLHGRMLIPKPLRGRVLNILHRAHQGVVGMKSSARQRLWWPGLNAALDQKRAQCRDCIEMAPSNHKEPLQASPEPDYPWQHTVADYFTMKGNNYLAVADRFSGWLEVYQLDGKTTTLIKTLRNLFAQMGVPAELASDGGPSFTSHVMRQFLYQWDINLRLSSAHYPQSNGRAELAVKTCKRLLTDNMDLGGRLDTAKMAVALLQYRNTPLQGVGYSPAQILFGRHLKDALPSPPHHLRFQPPTTVNFSTKYGVPPSRYWDYMLEGRERGASKKLAQSREQYDEHSRPLTPLSVGDCVAIQNRSGTRPLRWDRTGRIVERLENRQYLVKTDGSGRVLLRTRGHLRKIDPGNRTHHGQIDSPPGPPVLIDGEVSGRYKVIDPMDRQEDQRMSGELPDVDMRSESPRSYTEQGYSDSDTETAGPRELVNTEVEDRQIASPREVVIPELRRGTRNRVMVKDKDTDHMYY